ncbi:MAG: efflux RND transporter periplasmic adaptor subunit [Gemmatimonadota bacterium]|jgi:RND family efflux transporter MFP subunit
MTIDGKRRGSWTGRVLVLAGTACVIAGCGGTEADGAEGPLVGDEGFARVVNVETEALAPRRFVEVIRLTGTVEANRDVTVSAEESGVVRELFVEKGSSVRPEQPIAKIDDRILRSQVDQAEAQAALAEETWQRRKRLYEEDGIGSELAYLEARYGAEQAKANLQTLRERLERTVVRAPIGGVLDDRMVEVGTMVNPGAPVARIVDLDPVKITAGVPERYATDVGRGAAATVTFDVLDDQLFEGSISFVGAAVNPRNRTFPVELTLPNPGRAIKPEMVANVEVTRRELQQALVVPQEALVRVEDGYVVFVVEEQAGAPVARMRPVTLGPSQRDEVVVTEGLEAGDRLVVVGQKQVAEGDRVRLVGEAGDA